MNALLLAGGHVIDPANGIDVSADVLVRDGRPVEPNETQAFEDETSIPAADLPVSTAEPAAPEAAPPAAAEPAMLPTLPDLPPAIRQHEAQHEPQAGRLFVGASVAVAAVVASRRKSDDRTKEVDQMAESIGRSSPPTHSRWWRFSSNSSQLIGH